MTREDIIRLAREAGAMFDHMAWVERDLAPVFERFAELVRADSRNATLDEIATKIEAMPFGDTAASFAVWIREQKT